MIRHTNHQHARFHSIATDRERIIDLLSDSPGDTDHAGHPTDVATPLITQRQLSRFRRLTALLAKRKQLRRELLGLLKAGAPIEPGPLSPHVRVHRARRFSHASLRELLGDEGVDWMLTQIEPTVSTVLRVRQEDSEGAGSTQDE